MPGSASRMAESGARPIVVLPGAMGYRPLCFRSMRTTSFMGTSPRGGSTWLDSDSASRNIGRFHCTTFHSAPPCLGQADVLSRFRSPIARVIAARGTSAGGDLGDREDHDHEGMAFDGGLVGRLARPPGGCPGAADRR